MSYDCVCDYDDPPEFYWREVRKARKQHTCHECRGTIAAGEQYEHVRGKWEGDVDTFKTCQRCIDLRIWTKNNVPCLCWAHGNADQACTEAVEDACRRAPAETVGLHFGLLRRIAARNKLNRSRKVTAQSVS